MQASFPIEEDPAPSYREIVVELIHKLTPSMSVGAELGVARGRTSNKILQGDHVKHLYMVDPWSGSYYDASKCKELPSWFKHPQEKLDTMHNYVKWYFNQNFPGRTTVIRKCSGDATNDVPDELDFVFIDGNHDYEYVMDDLIQWVPKVKSGGVVIGDDWQSKRFSGLIQSVEDYCQDHDVFITPLSKDACQKLGLTRMPHQPAPSKKPVVNRSYPGGHVWWAIKK